MAEALTRARALDPARHIVDADGDAELEREEEVLNEDDDQ